MHVYAYSTIKLLHNKCIIDINTKEQCETIAVHMHIMRSDREKKLN